MGTSIERFLEIEKRIDAAETESLRDRWESGQEMLAMRVDIKRRRRGESEPRVSKQLPKGKLAELVETSRKSGRELRYRMQFADAYKTEDEVCNVLQTLTSWRQVISMFSRNSHGDRAKRKPYLKALSKDLRRQVESEIKERVRAEVEAQVALARNSMRVMQEQARRILDGRKGIFTPAEWSDILFVCHPDQGKNVSDEQRANVFRLLKEADILLLKR